MLHKSPDAVLGFWLVGFLLLPVSGLYFSRYKHTTEHHCPRAQLPTKSPKGTPHFHSSQSFMLLFLTRSFLLALSACTQELPTSISLREVCN